MPDGDFQPSEKSGHPPGQVVQTIQHQESCVKEESLVWNTPSVVQSFADAVVMKNGSVFFLTNPNGNVPLAGKHELGLYYHDCRYLNGYELQVAGQTFSALLSEAERGCMTTFEFANSEVHGPEGEILLPQQLGVTWERAIDGENLSLSDRITFDNYQLAESMTFPVRLTFQAAFEDIFVVRGLVPPMERGELYAPRWDNGVLSFIYHGTDGLYRCLFIHFSPLPETTTETTAEFRVTLRPRERQQLMIYLDIIESPDLAQIQPTPQALERHQPALLTTIPNQSEQSAREWLGNLTRFDSDSLTLNRAMERSLRDLHMLRSTIDSKVVFAAGLPQFATLFGRDSIVTAIQTLA
jgi:glycogen debranching enzyme